MPATSQVTFVSNSKKLKKTVSKDQSELRTITADVQMRMRRSVGDVLFIGGRLAYVKESLLGHGEFESWCMNELGISRASRNRMMQAYQRFGQMSQLESFSVSILYLLAAPSTPDSAVREVLSLKAGERLTVNEVKRILSSCRERKRRKRDRLENVQRQLASLTDEEFREFLLRIDAAFSGGACGPRRILGTSSWERLNLKPGASVPEIEERAEVMIRRYDPQAAASMREKVFHARDQLLNQSIK